jgi:transposase-like protein
MCQGLDEQVQAFRTRPLTGRFPYLWLDAKIEKVRDNGTVRQKALVVAYAVNQDGQREVLGLDVGEAETEAFWTEFLHDLRARGLTGVQLVISDAHRGLRNAIGRVIGARWQRCTVHFLRDMLGHVSRTQQPAVATAIRQVFNSEHGPEARERLGEVVDRLAGPAPKVARLLAEAEEDLLGYYGMPSEHWRKLRSTNPLERLNKEIARRSDVVGIYPNDQALLRLAGMVLIEQHEEWQIGRRYLSELSMRRIPARVPADTTPTLEAAASTARRRDGHGLVALRAPRPRPPRPTFVIRAVVSEVHHIPLLDFRLRRLPS